MSNSYGRSEILLGWWAHGQCLFGRDGISNLTMCCPSPSARYRRVSISTRCRPHEAMDNQLPVASHRPGASSKLQGSLRVEIALDVASSCVRGYTPSKTNL